MSLTSKSIIIVAGLTLVAAAGTWLLSGKTVAQDTASTSQTEAASQDAGSEVAQADESKGFNIAQDMVLGNVDSPVTIIEYSSFTCPHCANFHLNVYPTLKSEYIDTNKVHYIAREVYFDGPGLWAGLVARCGDGQRYFGIQELLFNKQKEWARADSGEAIGEGLKKIGKQAGLSDEQLDACLQNEDAAKALIETYQTNAAKDNVNSTPSFVINGKTMSNMSIEEFRSVLDKALEEAN